MEHVYQQRIETTLSRALPDVAFYMVCGLAAGSVLEYIMPHNDEEKDSIALILEIFAQFALLVFVFMIVNSKGGGRNGLIVYVLSIIGTQPTLFEKINALRELVFGKNPVKKHGSKFEQPVEVVTDKTEEIEEEQDAGATSISNLPQM
jgi:hypothetical protein